VSPQFKRASAKLVMALQMVLAVDATDKQSCVSSSSKHLLM
jgi:hypothetical protein